jgi:hypothetical protein
MFNKITEGVESGDLKRLVEPNIHIDEFKSKMGDDKDICVISYRLHGKEPGFDMINFFEIGYDYVLDADVSSGELEDGDYVVFIELERSKLLPQQIMELTTDLLNLTEQEIDEWTVKYRGKSSYTELTQENLARIIPLTPQEYESRFGSDQIDSLKAAAGVEVKTKAPKNDYTESLRVLAGII